MFGNMMEGYCWCFYNRFYITVFYKDLPTEDTTCWYMQVSIDDMTGVTKMKGLYFI